MRIGSDNEHVDILALERTSPGAPVEDIRVKITVTLREFFGTYDSVYLELSALAEFVESLICLERTRFGEAVLQSMSPDEFSLKLRSRDGLGHLVVEATLQRHQYSGPTYWPTKVSGGFELEAEDLPKIVSQFRGLVDG